MHPEYNLQYQFLELNPAKQYQFIGNELTLKVKKAPLFIRAFIYSFSFISFLLPLAIFIIGIALGNGPHIVFLIIIFLFGLMGFYLLRVALWNTYGTERILFSENQIQYVADYGWFKDGAKQKEINGPIAYSIRQIGYDEENKGILVIGNEEPRIVCATKMNKDELTELVEILTQLRET